MYTYTTPTITCTLTGIELSQVDFVRIAVKSKTAGIVRVVPAADIDSETKQVSVMNALSDIRCQYVIDVYRAPIGELNVDGWEQDQALQHMINCINSDGHKLT